MNFPHSILFSLIAFVGIALTAPATTSPTASAAPNVTYTANGTNVSTCVLPQLVPGEVTISLNVNLSTLTNYSSIVQVEHDNVREYYTGPDGTQYPVFITVILHDLTNSTINSTNSSSPSLSSIGKKHHKIKRSDVLHGRIML